MGPLRQFALIAVLCLVELGGAESPRPLDPRRRQRTGRQLRIRRTIARIPAHLAQEREEAMEAAGPPPPAPPPPRRLPATSVSGSRVAATAQQHITNNQVAGVDEGDIVKLSGDFLVILRRGRLFTVSLASGGMRPVSMIDAFPPGVDGRGDWYDEMLVAGGRVIVIGYSYARHGTQVNRFRLDDSGRLTFEDSYQLRSNDYYSSRNYATRLIGNRLILYSPLAIRFDGDPMDSLLVSPAGALDPRRRPADRFVAPGLCSARPDGAQECAPQHAPQRHQLRPFGAGSRLRFDGGGRAHVANLLRLEQCRLYLDGLHLR
jgi:hypothetical protein